MSQTTIAKKFYVDDVLTDPTSIKLSDATGTYGVRRVDTEATVVTDGTSMTKVSTGSYSHTFTDPAYDLNYEYCVEVVYGGETYYFSATISGTETPATAVGQMTLSEYITKIKRHTRDWGQRQWNDDLITDILNEGYLDFVKRTECLRKNGSIGIEAKTYTFSLPNDNIKILRYQYDKNNIRMVTDDFMDKVIGTDWREITSNHVQYIVHQMLGASTIRIYPMYEDFDDVYYDIDDTHNQMIFSYDSGENTTITLDNATYTGADLATELGEEIDEEFDSSSTVTFNNTTGKFSIDVGADHTISYIDSGSTAGDRFGFFNDMVALQSLTGDESVRLWIDYAYKPTAMDSDDDAPAIPEEYHNALFYYTMDELLKMYVGSEQDPIMAMHYHDKYMWEIRRMRTAADLGFSRNPDLKVIPHSFI